MRCFWRLATLGIDAAMRCVCAVWLRQTVFTPLEAAPSPAANCCSPAFATRPAPMIRETTANNAGENNAKPRSHRADTPNRVNHQSWPWRERALLVQPRLERNGWFCDGPANPFISSAVRCLYVHPRRASPFVICVYSPPTLMRIMFYCPALAGASRCHCLASHWP